MNIAQKYMIDEKSLNLALDKIKKGNVVLYAMSGKMGTGKDTIGDKIYEILNKKGFKQIKKVSYSTSIKKEIQDIIDFYKKTNNIKNTAKQFNANPKDITKLLQLLNNNNIYERSVESRLAIQFWGTDVRRKQNKDYWVNKLVELVINYLNENISVFVSDVRFPNEASSITDIGGKIIRLEVPDNIRIQRIVDRDNLTPTHEQLNHASETLLDNYKFDKIFDGCKPINVLAEETSNYILHKKGIFITLEGPDGSGKSTIAKLLKEYIENMGHKCILTREPGGTKIGEEIRNILLDNNNTEMAGKTEALLYAASRCQHVEEKIKPLLDKGYVVISDRYVFSSLAYQGYSRGLGIEKVMEINKFAMGELYPDSILFFDVSPEIALSRKFINREGDRLENEGESFHKKTYKGYKNSIKMYNKNVNIINANETIDNTLKQCIEKIDNLL